MKIKNSLAAFTRISVATLAIAITLNYFSPSQAFKTNPTAKNNTTVQKQLEEAPARVNPVGYTRVGTATYTLRNPAIQFDYDPNFFVLEVSETFRETVNPSPRTPWVSSVHLWTKRDYILRENSGDELGDFANKLNISVVDENSEGLPLQDWILSQRDLSEVKNVKKLDTTIAGREAWGFSHQSLFEYNNIVFKDELSRVIMLSSLSSLPNDATADPGTEPVINALHYENALSRLIESIKLTTAISDESNQ